MNPVIIVLMYVSLLSVADVFIQQLLPDVSTVTIVLDLVALVVSLVLSIGDFFTQLVQGNFTLDYTFRTLVVGAAYVISNISTYILELVFFPIIFIGTLVEAAGFDAILRVDVVDSYLLFDFISLTFKGNLGLVVLDNGFGVTLTVSILGSVTHDAQFLSGEVRLWGLILGQPAALPLSLSAEGFFRDITQDLFESFGTPQSLFDELTALFGL